ncbi:hypothetical protein PP713_07725 [Mycobacterium sp. CSUR Q5927]|nr:hypothetical protein [Mycobacterium sp. CSUR Q5927]
MIAAIVHTREHLVAEGLGADPVTPRTHLARQRPQSASATRARLAPVTHTAAQLQALITSCEQFRGAKAPTGYRDGLALCIVDSVQSTGVTYSSVERIVDRYRAYRRDQGGDPNSDGVPELLATFEELGGPDSWAEQIGNRNRTSTRNGVLKAEAIRAAAQTLAADGIETTADLRDAAGDEDRLVRVGAAWRAVAGQRSGITWHYVQMLAGIPGVKPDRMICRFVADSLTVPRKSITTEFAGAIVTAAAEALELSLTDLDHAIWQWQRMRK